MIIQPIDAQKPLLDRKTLHGVTCGLVDGRYFAGTDPYNHQVIIHVKNIVGYCHYYYHPGLIAKGDLKEHDCIAKRCRHFEPYTHLPYLRNRPELMMQIRPNRKQSQQMLEQQQAEEALRLEREEKKKAQERAKLQAQIEKCKKIKDMAEYVLGEMNSWFLYIIRVEETLPGIYKLFTVSEEDEEYDMSFEIVFQENLSKMYPGKYIIHRIPAIFGEYATIYDYKHRNKNKIAV